ncbi:LysR family transcriptional regulator [Vibrio sp. 99-70-13A1]|uniref:LysR family transcriptional regulator n=1 Tax=Vibrio sp. 99-70-13A1 TaxID=2607601 RepID=UPI0014932DD8|nr:LysR family transcriptional regulator [Vibrio sp. 99-70-13A1]NOH97737.1 LysR family transcriptional regulator [Vibrio sp. 99-70-13A1]
MRHSDFSLIPTFIAIYEQGSYTAAAKKMNLSQSAVSQSVVRLRDLFQDPLFVIDNRKVTPTPYAIDIYPELSKAVDVIKLTTPQHRQFDPATFSHHFSISSLSVFGLNLLPSLSKLWLKTAPNAKLRISPLVSNNQDVILRNKDFDVLLDIEHKQYPHLCSKVLIETKVAVICREDHPRLTGDSITLDQYLTEKHVVHSSEAQKEAYLVGKGVQSEDILKQRDVAWYASNIHEFLPIIEQTDCLGSIPINFISDRYLQLHGLKVLSSDLFPEIFRGSMYWHKARDKDIKHRWLREMLIKASKL